MTHSKPFARKDLIKERFTEMLAGLKEFTRGGGHQGSSKDGKPLQLVLKEKQEGNSVPETSEK